MAHVRQSGPDCPPRLRFQVLQRFEVVPSSRGVCALPNLKLKHTSMNSSTEVVTPKEEKGAESSEEASTKNVLMTLTEGQGQDLALTVVCVPHSLDSGLQDNLAHKKSHPFLGS